MINPFEYVPVRINNNNILKAHLESKWGMTICNAKHEVRPSFSIVLIDKKTYNRIVAFMKPIEGQYEWQQMSQEISQDMIKTLWGKHAPTVKEKEALDLYKKVSEQWKDRISHSNGGTLFQYNAKVGVFGDQWVRQFAVHSDCYEAPMMPYGRKDNVFKKTNYLAYFWAYYGSKAYCSILNFINRKKIKEDQEKQKKAFNEAMEDFYGQQPK